MIFTGGKVFIYKTSLEQNLFLGLLVSHKKDTKSLFFPHDRKSTLMSTEKFISHNIYKGEGKQWLVLTLVNCQETHVTSSDNQINRSVQHQQYSPCTARALCVSLMDVLYELDT